MPSSLLHIKTHKENSNSVESVSQRRKEYIKHLEFAELQFRLASAINTATVYKNQPLDVPDIWSHGRHIAFGEDLKINQEQAEFAALGILRSTTFLMAVAVRNAIRTIINDPKNSQDFNILSAYQISRLIRNSFTHAPFDPVWNIDADCKDKLFSVYDIISLNTAELHDQKFDWRHYGGPLALFRLSQFTRKEICKDDGI